MAAQEFLVIKRGYDFSKWLLQHTGKFPKSYRFSIAAKLENAIQRKRRRREMFIAMHKPTKKKTP